MRNPASKVIFSSATMKVQVALLLCLGLALQLSLPIGVDASRVHPAQFYERSGKLSARQHRPRGAVTVPGSLSDSGVMEYFTQFHIGTPPREFQGVADTGSDVVWVQCSDCIVCLPDEPDFQPNRSTTFESISCSQSLCSNLSSQGYVTHSNCAPAAHLDVCEYELGYGTGYSNGDLSTDVLSLSSQKGQDVTFPSFVFGCAFNSGNGVDPILALSRSSFSLVGQLEPEEGKAFSICFSAYGENKTTQLTLGSKGMQTKDLKYTPLIAPSVVQSFQLQGVPGVYGSLYYANVNGISIDGKEVHIPKDAFSLKEGGIVLDTGTSFTALASKIYDPLRAALQKKITYHPTEDATGNFDLCYDITSVNVTSIDELNLPSITFHFQDLDLQLPTTNAFINFPVNSNTVCFAMNSAGSNIGGDSIFGNFQMQNSYYLFDLENNRVGIKPESC